MQTKILSLGILQRVIRSVYASEGRVDMIIFIYSVVRMAAKVA